MSGDTWTCAACGVVVPVESSHICHPRRTPDTPELDLALALATCIGALQAHDLPNDEATKALWRWRNARGMNEWPRVDGATTVADDIAEAEVVSG